MRNGEPDKHLSGVRAVEVTTHEYADRPGPERNGPRGNPRPTKGCAIRHK